jgi:replicative DNA helicase
MWESMRELNLDAMIRVDSKETRGPLMYIGALDWKLQGIGPGNLVVIGGYVGSYKTLLGINVLYNNVVNQHYNGCFISLEMYAKEIYRRLAVRHAGNPCFGKYNFTITMAKLMNKEFSPDEEDFFYTVVVPDLQTNSKLGSLTVIDSLALAGADIENALSAVNWSMKEKSSKGIGLHFAVIDYIQLYAQYWSNAGIDRISATGIVARGLKTLAQTFDGRGITIFALSQLSRAAFMAARDQIRNSHESDPYEYIYGVTSFAESSEIERASDVCITVFSDDKLKERKRAIVQLIKNRNGETIDKGFEVLALPDVAYIGDIDREEGKSTVPDISYLMSDIM